MHPAKKTAIALCCALLLASAARAPQVRYGSFGLPLSTGPFVSASRIRLSAVGAPGRSSFAVVSGGGAIDGAVFTAPAVTEAAESGILGAAQGALAFGRVQIVPPPDAHRALIAVAAYEQGVALHDPRTFKLIGYAGIGGPPGDVAFAQNGDLLAPDTDGNTLAWFTRKPWAARWIDDVPVGNEVAADQRGNAFVTNRDIGGNGALTRISPQGKVARIVTGITAEGLAIDPARAIVYAGNVNDRTVAEIDASTMTVRRTLHSPVRSFGVALDSKRQRLYVVANISSDMRSGAGYVSEIDLRAAGSPEVARSAGMTFPLAAALDERSGRLFVSDESADAVYVLNAATLRAQHAPLATCKTPWRLRIFHGLLYVPCARADSVDVIDTQTLKRVRGAPFRTGGFPLSVAVWP